MTVAQSSIGGASEDIRRSKIQRLMGVSDVTQATSDGVTRLDGRSDLYNAVGELVSRLDTFMRIADTLSEVGLSVLCFSDGH